MPKGMQRGNKEIKKPKKDRTSAPASVPAFTPTLAAAVPKRRKGK